MLTSVTGTQFRKKLYLFFTFLELILRLCLGLLPRVKGVRNGGVWEWTCTVFDKVDGFVPLKLYPWYYSFLGLKS